MSDTDPWPGLLPFHESDRRYFKGRTWEAGRLTRLVARERLAVLYGKSGMGKTSLLRAGLFPRLRKSRLLPFYLRLDFEDSPTEQMREAIRDQCREFSIDATPWSPQDGLWEFLHRRDTDFWSPRTKLLTPVLVFDQFERLFTSGRRNGTGQWVRDFIEELGYLVKGRTPPAVKSRLAKSPEEFKDFTFTEHPYKILFSLREDYLAELETLSQHIPGVYDNQYRLKPMDGDAGLKVVSQATELIRIEDAERVVTFVANAEQGTALKEMEVEPALLSVFCRELNLRRKHEKLSRITAKLIESSSRDILEKFYDRSVKPCSWRTRRVIEQRLVIDGKRGDSVAIETAVKLGMRRRDLRHLVQRRVVRIEESQRGNRVALIHDRLAGTVKKRSDQRQLFIRTALALVAVLVAVVAVFVAFWVYNLKQRSDDLALVAEAGRQLETDPSEAVAKLVDLSHPDALETATPLIRDAFHYGLTSRKTTGTAESATTADSHAATGRFVTAAGRAALVWEMGGKAPVELLGHTRQISSVAFSAEGDLVVTASRDGSARIWDVDGGFRPTSLVHEDSVRSASFSRDGNRIVTVTRDRIRVWDWREHEIVREIRNPDPGVTGAWCDSTCDRLVLAFRDGSAQVRDSLEQVSKLDGHSDRVLSASFNSEENRIVTASADGTAAVWEVSGGTRVQELEGHADAVRTARFSPRGEFVLTGSADNTARLWHSRNAGLIWELRGHAAPVLAASFVADGRRVMTVAEDSSAREWRTISAAISADCGPPDASVSLKLAGSEASSVPMLKVSREGAVMVVSARRTQLWDLTKPDRREGWPTAGTVLAAAFPDRETALTLSAEAPREGEAAIAVVVRNRGREVFRETLATSERPPGFAAFSDDGRLFAVPAKKQASGGNAVYVVYVWTRGSGNGPLELEHPAGARQAIFGSRSRRMAVVFRDRVRIWDLETGRSICDCLHDVPVVTASFSKESELLVTVADGIARIWTIGRPPNPSPGADQPAECESTTLSDLEVRAASFSPEGAAVVTASGKAAIVWNSESGLKTRKLQDPDQGALFLARFDPSGEFVVTASSDSADRLVRLWRPDHGSLPAIELRGHCDNLVEALFTPNGDWLVTGSKTEVRAWPLSSAGLMSALKRKWNRDRTIPSDP